MTARILWIIVLIAAAAGTAGIQLDRQARVSAGLAPVVPAPFRAFAQARITASAIANEDPQTALIEAQTLVQRRPIPAENLRLLAAAQLNAGYPEKSALTVQYAAMRGWRDPIPQEVMMRIALSAGDKAEAARRFTALLLRPSTDDAALKEVSEAIFEDEEGKGRQALAEIVAGTDRWHALFVRRGAGVLPAKAYVDALVLASAKGAVFDCNQLQTSLKSVENRPQNRPPKRPQDSPPANSLKRLITQQCR